MKKKLLIVTRGDAIGGGTEYLITIITMLHNKFNVDIHMTYSKEEIKNHYFKYFDYVTFHQIPIRREINPVADFISISKLMRLMAIEKFDIVHTNTSKGGIVGRVAAGIKKVPFIFHTVHGFAFHEQSSRFSILAYSLIERIAAHFCSYIITVSDFHKEWAVKLKIAKEDKVLSIPNGLDSQRVAATLAREQIRKELCIGSSQIAIFTIGRLAKQKGIEHLLDAIKLLEGEPVKNDYHFYIVGSGELKEHLIRKAKQLSLESKVTFLGHRSDVNNLLHATDIIAIPSLREGLSIALLEAMAAEKAIISTDIGSNLTVIEHGKDALIVKCKDSVGLKVNIRLLIEDVELREKIASEAYKKFNARFTKEIMTQRYCEFYKTKVRLEEKRC